MTLWVRRESRPVLGSGVVTGKTGPGTARRCCADDWFWGLLVRLRRTGFLRANAWWMLELDAICRWVCFADFAWRETGVGCGNGRAARPPVASVRNVGDGSFSRGRQRAGPPKSCRAADWRARKRSAPRWRRKNAEVCFIFPFCALHVRAHEMTARDLHAK